MGWFTVISQFLGLGDVFKSISGDIAKAQIAKANATTDQSRIAADQNIKMLQARAELMAREGSTSNANLYVRAGLAFPVIFVMSKILIYDKAFNGSTTLSPELWEYIRAVVQFYLLYEGVNLVKGTVQSFRK